VRSVRDRAVCYRTKDGSTIRELLHPDHHPVRGLSLAEALVAPGAETASHVHDQAQEIYHVTAGQGLMTLGRDRFSVGEGDSVLIPAGTPHSIANTGEGDLTLLCICSPAYSHDDTRLLD
jgi:mannose-6-phosphate isomerase-like protein (cupin superfamily)